MAIKPHKLLKYFIYVQSRHRRHKAGGAPTETWQTSHAGSTARPGAPSPAACAGGFRLLSPGESRAVIRLCRDVAHPDAVSLPGCQLGPPHRSRLNRFLWVRLGFLQKQVRQERSPFLRRRWLGGVGAQLHSHAGQCRCRRFPAGMQTCS